MASKPMVPCGPHFMDGVLKHRPTRKGEGFVPGVGWFRVRVERKRRASPVLDGSEWEALLKSNGLVTRADAAARLRVSTKTIQRMEADGRLKRCRGLEPVVRYRARDVERLASALGEEA